jgi:hypothetical protein
MAASEQDRPKRKAAFALIWVPEKERPPVTDFASALNDSKTLEGEKLNSTSEAIRYAAKTKHPQEKAPWIKAHFASSPREFIVLSPADIKAAAAQPGAHWTEYA